MSQQANPDQIVQEQPDTPDATAAVDEPKYLRRIRSFVLREGRLTKGQERSLTLFWPTMGLEHQTELYDLEQVFGRKAPLVLENWFWHG